MLTLRPLGMLRLLRRVVTVLVAISVAYLAWWLFTRPELDLASTGGSWAGFWAGTDAAIAVAVSWIPVASDFSRHSRRVSTAFTSATVGYGVTQILCFVVGLAALALVGGNGDEVFAPMLAAPLGLVALLVLTARETDQSFANVYSTAVSVQNLAPRADRRLLCLAIGDDHHRAGAGRHDRRLRGLPRGDRLGVRAPARGGRRRRPRAPRAPRPTSRAGRRRAR